MTWDLFYLWKYMHCIWHLTHDLWHLNTLSNASGYYISYQTEYIWQHTHCISVFTPRLSIIKPHCVYDNTGTICMTSCEYIWHHIHSLWYHTMLWHSHTLYSCLHTQDTCHRIHCCWALTYSVLNIAYLQYVFSQTDYMYDIIWILCDITTALYDITRLYSWHHIHNIHDITPTVYDMTHTLLVISQPL